MDEMRGGGFEWWTGLLLQILKGECREITSRGIVAFGVVDLEGVASYPLLTVL